MGGVLKSKEAAWYVGRLPASRVGACLGARPLLPEKSRADCKRTSVGAQDVDRAALSLLAALGALQLIRQSGDIGLHLLALALYRKQPLIGCLELRSQNRDLFGIDGDIVISSTATMANQRPTSSRAGAKPLWANLCSR